MRQPCGEIAVAREQQQPFGVVVEPADRIDVVADAARGEQIDHRRPMLWIRAAGDVAARLVEEDVQVRLRPRQPPAVNPDFVGGGIGFRSKLGDGLAVDRHAALR